MVKHYEEKGFSSHHCIGYFADGVSVHDKSCPPVHPVGVNESSSEASAARYSWTRRTAAAPSPTAEATRLAERYRAYSRRKNSGDRRLEWERRALERPAGRAGTTPHCCAASRDIAIFKLNRLGKPTRAGGAPDQHEECGGRHLRAMVAKRIVKGQAFEVILSVSFGDLRVQTDGEVGGCFNLPDQVIRHRAFQVLASHYHGYPTGIAGEVQGRLARRVSRADDKNITAFHCPRLASASSVINATADEGLEARNAKTAPCYPCGDDDRPGAYEVSIGKMDDASFSIVSKPTAL